MKEQLITFETAKLAKEKGFDIKVETFYMGDSEDNFLHNAGKKDNWNNYKCIFSESGLSDDYSAPTQSFLQRWLREVHDTNITILLAGHDYHEYVIHAKNRNYIKKVKNPITPENIKNNWEDTLEKGLQEALKLIKNE